MSRRTSSLILSSTVLSVLLASGCATGARRPPAPEPNPAASYVDAQMASTVASIDSQLRTLILLERGDEAPRLPTPLGDTVAGAAAPKSSPREPASSRAHESRAHESRSSSQTSDQTSLAAARAALDTPVEVVWDGPYSGMLSDLARAIGFSFRENGKGSLGSGHINMPRTTVGAVLEKIAEEVSRDAQVRVILADRRIEVVYK